uniref:Putative resolvase domain containing protein n=1 Tax=viral metagenome TaxID=1070528 RepID=A0A6M3LMU7_9ZZZZ
MKISQYAKENSVTYMTAYRMVKSGKLPHKVLPTGTIVILEAKEQMPDYTICYARVSSSQNKPNLISQSKRIADFCAAKGWIVKEIIEECASGLNDKRPKLQKILHNPKVTRIVIEHSDRLTRFGMAYIKTLFQGEIVIINEVEDDKIDLMQDFVSLITSMCARLYGQRRTKRKTERIIKELNSD